MTKPGGDSGSGSGRRKSRAQLSEEDVALWQHTASSLEPLRGAKPRVAHGAENEPLLSPPRPQLKHDLRVGKEQGNRVSARMPKSSETMPAVANQPPRATPPLSDFDTRAARRLRSGRIEIEGRLDLHGFRQSDAHSALSSFLRSAHAEGKRWVLVITGKGGPVRAGMLRRDPEMPDWMVPERGILRRNVPRWLSEPEMRAIVVSYTAAAIHHGGDGAMYIQLRARRT